jgi:hypothetical protein
MAWLLLHLPISDKRLSSLSHSCLGPTPVYTTTHHRIKRCNSIYLPVCSKTPMQLLYVVVVKSHTDFPQENTKTFYLKSDCASKYQLSIFLQATHCHDVYDHCVLYKFLVIRCPVSGIRLLLLRTK